MILKKNTKVVISFSRYRTFLPIGTKGVVIDVRGQITGNERDYVVKFSGINLTYSFTKEGKWSNDSIQIKLDIESLFTEDV